MPKHGTGPGTPPVKRPKTPRAPTTVGPESTAIRKTRASLGPLSDAEREEVARIAYTYWQARGGQGGSAEEDWLRAEEEYRERRAAPRGANA